MNQTKILIAASECYPFAKSGGLGDVIGALPKALVRRDTDIRVIIPKYGSIPKKFLQELKLVTTFDVHIGCVDQYVGILSCKKDGVTYYFIDNEYYFKRSELYGYYDDGERFVYFCRAVLECIPYIGFYPDILHCNDWQTALIPFLLKEQYARHYLNIKTVFTIHNLRYQGQYGFDDLKSLLNLDDFPLSLEYYHRINLMKGALYSADLITTVSPTYAEEIKTPDYGEGLEGVITDISGHLLGILNGIDTKEYDPKTDPAVEVNYDFSLAEKRKNKTALQNKLGLPENASVPVLAMVSRLVEQKGLDLIATVIHEILQSDLQLIILGTGDDKYEQLLRETAQDYPDKMRAIITFDEPLSRMIYATSDCFMIPSLFEPCGLTQMIAMRYGAVPIVRATGGLKDSVMPYDPENGTGTGFCFDHYNAHELLDTIQQAIKLYQEEPAQWDKLSHNAMLADFSWKRSAGIYLDAYRHLLSGKE